MKKALKIFFIIVAIAVMVVGIYFVFFDVDRRHSVYHDVSNVMTHKYNIDLYGDLSGLNELGVNDNTEVITEDNYPQLYAIRNRLFVVDEETKLVHGSQETGYFY